MTAFDRRDRQEWVDERPLGAAQTSQLLTVERSATQGRIVVPPSMLITWPVM